MGRLTLKPEPTLQDLQEYVAAAVKERGFEDETVSDLIMLLVEEIGELAKAARKHAGIKFAADTETKKLADEAADVLIYLLIICNKFGIDLEQAFRAKEEVNKQRTWS